MTWLFATLLCALAESIKDVFSKLSARKHASAPISIVLTSLLVSWPYFLYRAASTPLPQLDYMVGVALLGHVSLFCWSLLLYVEVVSNYPLSLTVPLICFTPLFLLATSPLMLGEEFSLFGISGIALIVFGALVLYRLPESKGILGPVKALANNQGARKMLMVAFLWSLTGNFDRLGVMHSSQEFWAALDMSAIILCLFVIRARQSIKTRLLNFYNCLAGVINGFAIYFYYWAISLQQVGYVISVKRTSVLFGVLLGNLIFKEGELKERLFGAGLMLGGVIAIAYSK